MYTHWTYVFVLLDSLYQSLALYFIPHIVWIQWVCVVVSFVLFWSFLLVSNAIFFTFDHPSNPYWIFMNTVSTASHSSIVILTVFVSLLPRLVVRSLQISVFPNEIGLAKRMEKQREQDLLRDDIGDVTTTTALNTHTSGNGRTVNSHISPMPSNTAMSDSSSIEGGQSEMRVLNTHLYTKNTSRRKESRFENRTFSSSSMPAPGGRGATSPDSQESEGGEVGGNQETYVRQRSHIGSGNNSDNAVNT
ncbi:phospholipid-transporting ATPase [Elysia marginata]|uniref:Phospholipid-transporting ATPase n=1 Tax=Elysia marginata TaxID=1093978 RepID=A0AAV4FG72_9GAST|nr:phospholipid-transporting ATPase [Elysia marginata]